MQKATVGRTKLGSVVGALLVSLLVSSTALAEAKVSAKAREHFDAGVAFLQDPDGAKYEEAYREFKTAYADSPSWKILGNLGIAAMKLERDGEAIAAFEKYLKEGQLDAEEKRTVERDLRTLRAAAAKLTLRFNEDNADVTDERMPVQGNGVRNRYAATGGALEIWVRSGHHKIIASVPGKPDVSWDMDANSGGEYTHDFDFAAPPAAPVPSAAPVAPPPPRQPVATTRPVPVSVWVGLAATAGLAIGAGVTGAMALDRKSQYDKANTGEDKAHAHDLAGQTRTFNLVSDVLTGAAVVGAGITTYLFVTRPGKPEGEQVGRRIQLAPSIGQTSWGVDMSGRF